MFSARITPTSRTVAKNHFRIEHNLDADHGAVVATALCCRGGSAPTERGGYTPTPNRIWKLLLAISLDDETSDNQAVALETQNHYDRL
jgi:hypothetical protein